MKRYLGSFNTLYSAIVSIVMIFLFLSLGIFIYLDDSSILGKSISIANFLGAFILVILIIRKRDILFCWGIFDEKGIVIRPLLKKSYRIDYSKCADVGIGIFYAGKGGNGGFAHRYIYLSYGYISNEHKCNINRLLPSNSCVKIGYNKKTYDYLVNVMPLIQSRMLTKDYNFMKERGFKN